MGGRNSKSVHDGCTVLVPTGWAASISPYCYFLPKPGWSTHSFLFAPFPQSRPDTCGGRSTTVLCMDWIRFFFLVLQQRAVFQSTPVRGSPASVYPEHLQHRSHSLAYVRHLSTTCKLSDNDRVAETCQVLQFLVLSQPCMLPLLSVHSVGARIAASQVPLTKDGVAFRLTVAWNRVLLDGISAADPKSILTQVYHESDHKPFTKGQTVKLSSTSNVKRESTSILYAFVNTFLCVTICGIVALNNGRELLTADSPPKK